MSWRIKYKGFVPDDDEDHQVMESLNPPLRAPQSVYIKDVGYIPQYASTKFGTSVKYDPSCDCDGYFTSAKYQVHNNCYNYGIDIATNTIAQPGRFHSIIIRGAISSGHPELVTEGAEKDGLIHIGGQGTTIDDLRKKAPTLPAGHFVALLIAPSNLPAGFNGDYHWVRCDDLAASSWSQKDGPDQVTNFDFSGRAITDPTTANWSVNNGPEDPNTPGSPDVFFIYTFQAYMFVPYGRVNII